MRRSLILAHFLIAPTLVSGAQAVIQPPGQRGRELKAAGRGQDASRSSGSLQVHTELVLHRQDLRLPSPNNLVDKPPQIVSISRCPLAATVSLNEWHDGRR